MSAPYQLGGWAKPIQEHMGGQPPASALPPTGHLGKRHSSVPGAKRGCPSSCTIYKYSDHRKGVHQRGQSTVLFNQGLHWPLESWLRRARRQEARGHTGVRVAHRQSLRSSGLHAARLARISEWGQHGGLRVKTGATKWRPGGTGGEEASGRLHGGGPSCR